MRMWMTDTDFMCRQHLLGEHNELHKWLPMLRRGIGVHGRFFPIVQIQFVGYAGRHNELAAEMIKRGYRHNSPLINVPDFRKIYGLYATLTVDKEYSLSVLLDRCNKCRSRFVRAQNRK